MTDQIKIIIRDVYPEDHNFIMATWLKGNYFGNSYFRQMPQDVYFQKYAEWISMVLGPNTLDGQIDIKIACAENDPTWIVGFSVSRGDSLYWIHVKKDYRGKGIATLLIGNKKIGQVKGMTKAGKAIAEKKGLIFNPL